MKPRSLFFTLALLPACIPQEETRIPYAPVNLTIQLSYSDSDLVPLYSSKVFPHGSTPLDKDRLGFGGLLVFHHHGGYQAYDLACPVEVSSKTVVVLEEGGLFAACPSCHTRYSLIDGAIPVDGSGAYRLHAYRVSQISSTELIISN
ncbi:MAG: hypothetical protein LBU08_03485 [Tannerellaceae bacterium]|jgi:nitrite reductase/ring-hydroxylating ferredoxin subunit|nr:hypothetical protein [Tannerellaceae bacterium]